MIWKFEDFYVIWKFSRDEIVKKNYVMRKGHTTII